MSGLMTERHKHTLNRNRMNLIANLQHLPTILDMMRAENSVTNDMHEEVLGISARDRQISRFIDMLSRRPDKAFGKFVAALISTGQEHVANFLDPSAVAKYSVQQQAAPVHPAMETGFQKYVSNGDYVHAASASYMVPQATTSVPGGILPGAQFSQTMPPHHYVPGPHGMLPVYVPAEYFRFHAAQQSNFTYSQQDDISAGICEIVNGSRYMNFMIQNVTAVDVMQLQSSQRIYSMKRSPRGRAVIISNHYFCKLQTREGADVDERNLMQLFTALHFHVVLYTNKVAKEIMEILREESSLADHEHADAFVLFLLTHGSQGSVFGVDSNKVPIDDITTLFDGHNCVHLRNKPKLFFIQACQGDKKSSRYKPDGPTSVQTTDAKGEVSEEVEKQMQTLSLEDVPGYVPPLPSTSDAHEKSDMLIAYATVKGYEAWRHVDLGSWFVRALVYVFSRHAHHSHIVDMLTEVNYLVSHLETQETKVPYRQVAEKTDTLLKRLYFLPGFSPESP